MVNALSLPSIVERLYQNATQQSGSAPKAEAKGGGDAPVAERPVPYAPKEQFVRGGPSWGNIFGNGPVLMAGGTNAPPPPPPPATAATVTSEVKHGYGPTPWVWNKWLPTNGGKGSSEYKHWHAMNDAANNVGKTFGALEKAQATEATAKKDLEAAQKARDASAQASADGKATPALEKKLGTAKTAYDKAQKATVTAQKAYDGAQAKVTSTSDDFRKFLKDNLKTAVAADPKVKELRAEKKQLDDGLAAEKAKKPDAKKVAQLEKDIKKLEAKKAPLSTGDQAKLTQAKTDLATENARKPDATKVADLEQKLKTNKDALDARKKAISDEIDAYQPIQGFDYHEYTVKNGNEKLVLRDHVQAYSTEKGGTGLALVTKPDRAGTETAIDNSAHLSGSEKKIVKAVSKFEGVFGTTENYDNGGVTWGALQWTTGKDGNGSVAEVMRRAKADHPAAYKQYFSDKGIDLDASGKNLVVTTPTGKKLSGADAVEYIRSDPNMTVAFAVAASSPDIQDAQLKSAKQDKIGRDALDRRATVTVNGQKYTFRAGDIFTSEVGAALALNAGVHAGGGGMQGRYQKALQAYFDAHPTADPTKPDTWKADADKWMWSRMASDDVDRFAYFKKNLNNNAGSYQP